MDRATKNLYFNLCNPDVPLEPHNEANVDLDSLNPNAPLRGENWVNKLADEIEFSIGDPAARMRKPACIYFTGLPGSGKSTEILRLRERLQGQKLLVVLIDADYRLDLTDVIDISDIYIAILYEVERQVLIAEGKNPDTPGNGVFARLGELLESMSIDNVKLQVSVLGVLALEMKEQPSLRRQVRSRVAAHTRTFLQHCRLELQQLQERAQKCGYAAVAVLLDSLEKLNGTSTNADIVLDSAERLFSHSGAQHLALPVHVLYTLPPSLFLRLRTHIDIEFMPMIKLWERPRDGEAPGHRRLYQSGLDAAEQLIRKRIPNEDLLRWFFGVNTAEALSERLQRVILWSGGYPREIIRLLRNVIRSAPLTPQHFERLLKGSGSAYTNLLLGKDLPWLARVATKNVLLPQDEEERQAADRMFRNNVVLRYVNTSEWFDLHPAVREMDEVKEAIQKLQSANAAPPSSTQPEP
ncbi:MAG: hypothetical protein U1A78_03825 [Polyangia bacterium]